MQVNPAEDWQRLTEHYREISDGELEELAADYADLTEIAQQLLRSEMLSRALGDPQAPPVAKVSSYPPQPSQWASSVDPDSGGSQSDDTGDQEDGPHDFTWKTLLCECEKREQAWQIFEVLKRAGIKSWVEAPSVRWGIGYPRVLVAADQLDEAREVAARPIPQEIVDQFKIEVPAFEAPRCPKCGAEDPVLESADPENAWLCESCGKQWMDPSPAQNEDLENTR
jgi:ribosomal protein L37AE/L43A